MAFDLVQYFVEQINTQEPQLLQSYPPEQRKEHVLEINALVLGKLITLWRSHESKVYQEICSPDELFIQEISRHLTTSAKNQSTLPKAELEHSITEVLQLQLAELKQLNDTGNLKLNGLGELLLGQIEHLSGQTADWVWSTNGLSELIGSKPILQAELSLDSTMKEFNQMVIQQQSNTEVKLHPVHETSQTIATPRWAEILQPFIALIILWVLYLALIQIFN